ncbi:MAG: hypothetical protein B5766_07915 [Candidatus Lumbricidophila eiseniae]|uniref:Uncharacterized protein n=1 Tax=Candidatus Lumbricidiphila eiseniae TaxID=1969409 RepID=A0A2A6FRJ8_9MICO|nr:MAG: hypothetical protein B5766_07915 [Candidatus Lumbricidophila eiseniae]
MQITSWIIHRQARPTDNANNSVPVNEYRIRRKSAIDDGLVEVPEHRIVGGFLPATDECGRNAPGIGGSANELNNRGAGVSGPMLRQARLDHEPGWESVDRGDHLTNRFRQPIRGRELIRAKHRAREEIRDNSAGILGRNLADVPWHRERQQRSDARCQCTQRSQVGGLLDLGHSRGRDPNEQLMTLGIGDHDRVIQACTGSGVRSGCLHPQPRHRGRRQRR